MALNPHTHTGPPVNNHNIQKTSATQPRPKSQYSKPHQSTEHSMPRIPYATHTFPRPRATKAHCTPFCTTLGLQTDARLYSLRQYHHSTYYTNHREPLLYIHSTSTITTPMTSLPAISTTPMTSLHGYIPCGNITTVHITPTTGNHYCTYTQPLPSLLR